MKRQRLRFLVLLLQTRHAKHSMPRGLRQAVEDAVAAASQDIKDDWEYAPTIRRHSPTVTALSAALGLSDAQIDALFTQAAGLSL